MLFIFQQKWMNTLPISTPAQYSSHNSLGAASRDQRVDTIDSLVKNLMRRRNLILALVNREVEFLSTWHNTSTDANLAFHGVEQLTKWCTQTTFTEKVWRDLARLAWHISPSLAVHLCARSVHSRICKIFYRISQRSSVRLGLDKHISNIHQSDWLISLSN